MLRFVMFLVAFASVLLGGLDMAEAAKKKPVVPAIPKLIYEAPMRVFVVRNSNAVCEPNCPEWIGAEGEITSGTPALFRKMLKQLGRKKLPVVIRSPGGSINAALEIGKMLRKADLTVAVGYTRFTSCSPADKNCKLPPENNGIYEGTIEDNYAFCNSACPMILAGGTSRFAGPFASIGLHEPKTTWTQEYVRYRETYRIIKGKKKVTSRKIISRKSLKDKVTFGLDKQLRKKLTSHYKSMGIDLAILDDTVKAKYQDIYYISEMRKSMLKLVTSSSSAVMLANPKFCEKIATCIVDKSKAVARLVGINQSDGVMRPVIALPYKAFCPKQCPFWIYGEGKITNETVSAFRTLLFEMGPKKAPIILYSDDGELDAGMALGTLLREYNRNVAVAKVRLLDCSNIDPCGPKFGKLKIIPATIIEDGVCGSSCTLALAGGIERISFSHMPLRVSGLDAYQRSSISEKILQDYFKKMGMQPDLMTAIRDIKPNKSSAAVGKSQTLLGLVNSGRLPTWLAKPELCLPETLNSNCIGYD